MKKIERLKMILADAKSANRPLTTEEAKEWDHLIGEVRKDQELRQMEAEIRDGTLTSVYSQRKENYFLADVVRSLKFGREAKGIPDEVRAVTSSSGSAAIQDPHVVDELIFKLQANSQLAEAGADFRPIANHMQMAKVSEYPSYHWQANEGDEIPVDAALSITSKKWDLKDLAIRVRVSNQYLLDSGERGRKLIEQSMVRQINQAVAQAVFTGSDTSGEPGGIETFTNLQTVDISPDAAMTDWTQIIEACRLLSAANVPIDKIAAFFSPTGWAQLASFADTTGQPLNKPALVEPVRFFNPTTLVLETYDTNTTTKMFLGDFSRLIVGFQGLFSITLDQSRASHLETEFMVHMRMDVQATHENNFAQITGILI